MPPSLLRLPQPELRLTLMRLAHRIPLRVRRMLTLFLSLVTFRNILLLFCLLNLKNLPLAWEIRLLYRGWISWKSKRDVARVLANASRTQPPPSELISTSTTLPASTHPLFAPLTITTLTPTLEIDHNLHKSNSTYFSDLDESRTALIIHLLSSTKFSPTELERAGYRGPFSVILGSVHASFLKEIKPYERYSIRSRILGWDEKWIVIGSVFVRSKNAADRKREERERRRRVKGEGKPDAETNAIPGREGKDGKTETENEVLLATCLSKYVVKKGRYTVPPERCWRSAGWLPEKPEKPASDPGASTSTTPPLTLDSSGAPTPDTEPADGEVKLTEADLRRRAQQTAARAAEKLRQSTNQDKDKHEDGTAQSHKDDEACLAAASAWKWEDIDAERKRGLKVAESWLGLDRRLKELWEEDFARGVS